MIRSVCVTKRSYISYLFSYSDLYSLMIRVQKTAGASPSSEKSKHDIDRAQIETTTLHASNETVTSTDKKWDERFRMYLSIWHPLICIWNTNSIWALISHLVRPTTQSWMQQHHEFKVGCPSVESTVEFAWPQEAMRTFKCGTSSSSGTGH